jgi:hypothetical protein
MFGYCPRIEKIEIIRTKETRNNEDIIVFGNDVQDKVIVSSSCLVDDGQDIIKYKKFILSIISIIVKITYLK